jgi:hypothetical protein
MAELDAVPVGEINVVAISLSMARQIGVGDINQDGEIHKTACTHQGVVDRY